MNEGKDRVVTSIAEKHAKFPAWRRTLQRHLLPRTLVSALLYIRDKSRIHPTAVVQYSELIRFGKGTVVKPYTVIQTSGGRIRFGDNCEIGSLTHIAAGMRDLTFGNHVKTGPHVSIIATTRQVREKDKRIDDQGFADRGIIIGDDVFIGAGAIVLDGCEIGDGAIIAAGSVVRGKIAPNSILAGPKADVIGMRQ